MISILSMVAFLAVLLWMALRRPFLIPLFTLLWVLWVWRLASVTYVDVAGPLYAAELRREIGGGRAAVWMVLAYLTAIAVFLIVFRRSRLRALTEGMATPEELRRRGPSLALVSNVVLAGCILLLALAFMQLFMGGVIPLFAGIERYIFTEQFSGSIHRLLVKYGIHLSFILGFFYESGRLRVGKPDRRFVLVLATLYFYLVLVGNRFSAFYSHTSFFLIPMGAVALQRWVARTGGGVRDSVRARGRARGWLPRVAGVTALLGLIVFAQYRSLVLIRGFAGEALVQNLLERLFVVQGELWVTSYDRVLVKGEYDPARTFDKLFVHPVWPDRNSTIPFLMEVEIGDEAYPILELGNIYTGGYPEILFELLGPVFGFVGLAVMAYLTAKWLALLVRSILLLQYIRIFLVFYVTYAFMLFSVSGMLNIFSTWKFLVKIGVAAGWILFEKSQALRRVARSVPVPVSSVP